IVIGMIVGHGAGAWPRRGALSSGDQVARPLWSPATPRGDGGPKAPRVGASARAAARKERWAGRMNRLTPPGNGIRRRGRNSGPRSGGVPSLYRNAGPKPKL